MAKTIGMPINPISVANAAYKGNKLYEEQVLDPNSTGNQKIASAVQKITDGYDATNEKISNAVNKLTENRNQKALQADAGELYNNENYGKDRAEEKVVVDNSKKFEEQLDNDASFHAAAETNEDYAHGREITDQMIKMGTPLEVVQRTNKRIEKDAHVDSVDVVNIKTDAVKFHTKKTNEFHKDMNATKSVMDPDRPVTRSTKPAPMMNKSNYSAIEKAMATAEATEHYDAGKSALEQSMEKY